MLKEEIKEICKILYVKILYLLIKICEMCIKDLNNYKGIRDNTYTFFLLI